MDKILTVEDDPKIAEFLAASLRQAGYLVDQAHDGNTGLRLALEQDYVALILDLSLPGLDGLDLLAELRSRSNQTPVIILSARQTVAERVRGLEIGADDYLAKPFSFSELQARLQAVLRRSGPAPSAATRLTFAGLSIDLLSRKAARNAQTIELMPNEFALLELLLRNAGQVISRAAIMHQIWGYAHDPGTNVVDVLVCRLRTKIDKDFDVKLLHTIRGLGYVIRLP